MVAGVAPQRAVERNLLLNSELEAVFACGDQCEARDPVSLTIHALAFTIPALQFN